MKPAASGENAEARARSSVTPWILAFSFCFDFPWIIVLICFFVAL